MSSTQYQVFTIGHSNHPYETFLALLRKHGVNEVVDVRSSPYSRYTPQFNYDNLNRALERAGIDHVSLGRELGGRPADSSCYDASGRVNYDRVANTDLFDDGISWIVRAADQRRIALLCTEKEPLDCHRALLIAKVLEERGTAVEHILADGNIERHDATMNRLMDIFNLPRNGDMFRSRQEVIADAITRMANKVAYVTKKSPGDEWRHVF